MGIRDKVLNQRGNENIFRRANSDTQAIGVRLFLHPPQVSFTQGRGSDPATRRNLLRM
jgi:hypothetical protein